MRFNGEGALKEFIVLGPFAWKEFLGGNWAIGGGFDTVVDDGGLVVELAQGTEGEDEIHATDIARIMLNVFPVIESIEPAFKVGAEKDRSVDVEMRKVDVDDPVDHFAVFRQPNDEFGNGWGWHAGV